MVKIHRKNLGSYLWTTSGSNKVLPGKLSYSTDVYPLNPATIYSLGGSKYSVLTKANIESNFKQTSSSDITVTAADFLDTEWSTRGWTTSNDYVFYGEIRKFVQNNFSQYTPYNDVNVILTRGAIKGSDIATSLLMHFDGNLNDSSEYGIVKTNDNAITYVGGKFGANAAYFDGALSQVNFSSASSGGFDFGSGNFTIDLWFNTSANDAVDRYLIGGTWNLKVNNGYIIFNDNSTFSLTSSGTYTTNVWNHVAIVRNGTALTMYLNGSSAASTTVSGSINFTSNFSLGCDNANADFYLGSIDELRITKGSALWITGFSVPVAAYDLPQYTIPFVYFGNDGDIDENTELMLHFDSSTDVVMDSSANNYTYTFVNLAGLSSVESKFGYSSVYIPGSLDAVVPTHYLSLTALNYASSNFTIEMWFNYALDTSQQALYGQSGLYSGIGLKINNGYMGYYATSDASGAGSWNLLNGDAGQNAAGSIPILPNTWTHVAFVRDGNNWYGFINGALDMQVNVSGTVGTNGQPYRLGVWGSNEIGGPNTGGYHGHGFIDEVRGSTSARYTSAFTPSDVPFTTDANTQFLFHFESFGIVDSSDSCAPQSYKPPSTNYQPGKFSPGTSLLSNGNYMTFHPTKNYFLDYNTRDFSVDCWFNTNSAGGGSIFSSSAVTLNAVDAANRYFQMAGVNANTFNSNLLVWNPNAWNHIAMSRSEFCQFAYSDGQLIMAQMMAGGGTRQTIPYAITYTGYNFNGYLDEYRISKIARYSPNFTPATSNYSDDSLTSLLLHFDNNATDSSSNSNTLTPAGSPTPTYAAGKINQAAEFSGGYFTLPTGSGGGIFDFSNKDFSIEFWINPSSYPASNGHFGIINGPNWWIQLQNNNGYYTKGLNYYFVGLTGPENTDLGNLTGYIDIPLNTWTHVAFSFQKTVAAQNNNYSSGSAAMLIFINGKVKYVRPAAGTFSFGSGNIVIGADNDGTNKFQGMLDELRISLGTVGSGAARWTGNFTPPVAPYGS